MSLHDSNERPQNINLLQAAKVGLRIAAFCCAAASAAARPVEVCLVNEASVSKYALRYMEAGLRAREKELAGPIRFTCESASEDAIIIRLRKTPAPNQRPEALGAALVDNGKVLRQVEVFCNPIQRMVAARGTYWPALEGWALATVAAHEMYHYLNNEHGHGNGHLNEKVMTAESLIRGFR